MVSLFLNTECRIQKAPKRDVWQLVLHTTRCTSNVNEQSTASHWYPPVVSSSILDSLVPRKLPWAKFPDPSTNLLAGLNCPFSSPVKQDDRHPSRTMEIALSILFRVPVAAEQHS